MPNPPIPENEKVVVRPLSSPEEIYEELFEAVQRGAVFEDQKTFVDCIPKTDAREIIALYRATKPEGEALTRFVHEHFLVPEDHLPDVPDAETIEEHIDKLWDVLSRAPDVYLMGSSLLPLPHTYVVPGGRFREVYYWDTYFTMLGLRESGREDLIESMVDNMAFLVDRYGLIPNGNRSYYLTRSQPPFFAVMVELLAAKAGDRAYEKYLPALRAEHRYWLDETLPTRHRATTADGTELHRYFDWLETPRPESFIGEEELAAKSKQDRKRLFAHIRAATESGWDFSSRWFPDGESMGDIRALDIAAVDLECLLVQLEKTLAKAYSICGDKQRAAAFERTARIRTRVVQEAFWSGEAGYFFDYDLKHGRLSESWTLAGVTPLFLGLATPVQAARTAQVLEERFLQKGGLVATLRESGEQWDWPNGWAPLQWMAISGLRHYGHHRLAETIALRWIQLNADVFRRTGKLVEKYNVVDTTLDAGGGEYVAQDGFGWTNGVLRALLRMYSG